MRLSIQTNLPAVSKMLTELQAGVRDQAMASALNKVVAQARTQMVRGITGEFNITAAKVRDSLRIIKARKINGVYEIKAALESPRKRGRSINLINFAARQTKAGVSVKIKRSGGRKVIKGAFIANQGRTVFARVGSARLPIKALQTIDAAQMFNTKNINSEVVRFIEDKLPSVFQNEAKFFTDRFNNRRAT
jgi:Prophage minor tail protein Z (GPZ)